MSNDVFSDILNKGVPVRLPCSIELSSDTIIARCKNNDSVKKVLDEHFKEFLSRIKSTFGNPMEFGFYNLCQIIIDETSLERKIILSPAIIKISILSYCGLINDKTKFADYSIINLSDDVIYEAIRNLRSITTEDELNEKTPELSKYFRLRLAQDNIVKLMRNKKFMSWNSKITGNNIGHYAEKLGYSYEEFNEYLKTGKLIENLSDFIEQTIEYFETLYRHSNDFSKYLYDYPINIEATEKDKLKLELYIAYRYLTVAKQVPKGQQQNYLYYLSSYFFENKELFTKSKGVRVFIQDEDIILDSKNLYNEYQQFLIENPNLKLIDFNKSDFNGMTLDEVEEFMDEYLKDLTVNWDFFKDSTLLDEDILTKVSGWFDSLPLHKREEAQGKIDQFMRKKNFFDRTDPYCRVKGKNTFDGYVGYIYPNGTVVLEKFFENYEKGVIATNQAIYVMPIEDFYNISRLSKNSIIAGRLCKRYIHKGAWEEKIEEEISKPGTLGSAVQIIDQLMNNGLIESDKSSGKVA